MRKNMSRGVVKRVWGEEGGAGQGGAVVRATMAGWMVSEGERC